MTNRKYKNSFHQAVTLVANAKSMTALTGAGISTASGIPAFRGSQGLWEKYDPLEFAHIDSFITNPGKVWRMLRELGQIVRAARPNPAHLALAELGRLERLDCIITQNVDNLHQMAGSRDVVEFHGNGSHLVCLACGRKRPSREMSLKDLPPRCECGGVLKPDVVFFGEPIPAQAYERAVFAARKTDVMLVVGTSAQVTPASLMPALAFNSGARIIEINLEPTPLTDSLAAVSLIGGAEEILPALVDAVRTVLGMEKTQDIGS